MSSFIYFVIPLLSALIGWITNKIAIKMLFWPKKSFLGIHGLIPKKRKDLARKIGIVIENELISNDDLLQQIDQEKIFFVIKEMIEKKIDGFFLSGLIPDEMKQNFVSQITYEIIKSLRENASDGHFSELFSIAQLVEDKINSFDLDRLERIIKDVAKREFTAIEIFGAVLGFVIGLLQLLLFLL